MSRNFLKIIGCGGHGKVVLDALSIVNQNLIISLCDSNQELLGKKINNLVISSTLDSLNEFTGLVHISIGNNYVREKISRLVNAQTKFLTIAHPSAIISATAVIQEGSFIAAGSILGPDCNIGKGCIINHGSVIDHDVKIENYAHVAPNSTLGGNVKVGSYVLIGAGSVVLPNLEIGDGAVVGAGSIVTKSVPANCIVLGVPAKQIRP